jgi:hypothetical protein
VKVKPGKTDVASLAAWLDRHQGEQLRRLLCACAVMLLLVCLLETCWLVLFA